MANPPFLPPRRGVPQLCAGLLVAAFAVAAVPAQDTAATIPADAVGAYYDAATRRLMAVSWSGGADEAVAFTPIRAGDEPPRVADPDNENLVYRSDEGHALPVLERAAGDGRLMAVRADGGREPVMAMRLLSDGAQCYLYADGRAVPVGEVDDMFEERRKMMGWGWITLTAAADGINPCAFASIVLLVSMMATARRTRRETVVIGLSFTLAVFLAYMAIGLVFHGVLQALSGYNEISDLVYWAAFLICAVCGLLSLVDAFRVWRTKDAGAMTLQLPKGFKRRIQKALSSGVRSSRLAVGTFVAGILVSGLEAACTGQVFFPFVAQLKEVDLAEAVIKVAWYCFVFILPLAAVFVLALMGVNSQQLATWMRKNMVLTKLALATVFVAMAAFLYPYLMWPLGTRASDGLRDRAAPAAESPAESSAPDAVAE